MKTNLLRKLALLAVVFALVGLGFILGTSALRSTAVNSEPSFAEIVANENAAQSETAVSASTNSAEPVRVDSQAQPVALPRGITTSEQLLVDLYNRVAPSVVSINVRAEGVVFNPGRGEQPEREDFYEGSGSGFVVDRQGHIVTNYHVVEAADRIEVQFFDGTIVRGEVVGLDPGSDIAVIKVNLPAEQLIPVQMGDSDILAIGQTAVAIGSPFGQRWTMTTGIISALDRTIQGLTQFSIGSVIQTDAAINPGNSGGPLLNLDGQVIGMNSQIISQTRSNTGIGFAVPSNLVKRVAADLISTGRVNYSYLGITGGEVDLDLIEDYNLPNNTRGAVVAEVIPGGPASQAGLRTITEDSVDIIVAIDGIPVTGMNSIISYLSSNTRPGDTVVMTVLRGGNYVELQVTLAERPRN